MKSKKPISLTHRISSVTNSFVQCLLPDTAPSASETAAALHALGQEPGETVCVYCGVPANDADHLRPLVKYRRPTGYLNEARNRVPACSICNTSKGGQEWRQWMEGSAKQGLRGRGFSDAFIAERIAVLERFIAWGNVVRIDFEHIIGAERWIRYWNRLNDIEQLMIEAQREAALMRADISWSCGEHLYDDASSKHCTTCRR